MKFQKYDLKHTKNYKTEGNAQEAAYQLAVKLGIEDNDRVWVRIIGQDDRFLPLFTLHGDATKWIRAIAEKGFQVTTY